MAEAKTATQRAAKTKTQTPIKGAEIVVRCLEQHGTEIIFAYPGGASMEMHQALRDSSIRVVLPRHEQGGAFAAAGYARATGRPGVCMATSGPGATNLVTAVADAYMDSVPLVVITGQVSQRFIGKNAFQEIDIIGMTRPIVKHSYLVLDPADLPEVMAEAFYLASSGRPGPVVLDIPKDVQQKLCVPEYPDGPCLRSYSVHSEAADEDVERLRQAIAAAERPCLYVGGGIIISGAHEELLQVAESYNIPVATSLMGIGAFPERHPLSLKWPGMHGTYYASYAVNECDLLIGIGMRFDDRVTGNVATFARGAKIVHVDIDPSEINKNKPADIGIVCDARSLLSKLVPRPIYKEYAAWHAQIRQWKTAHPLAYRQSDKILPPAVIDTLCRLTEGKATIVTGVGQHQMWAAQFYTFERPRQLLTSGGLGTMGFGLPSAIGAKLAHPDETVILIDGDGSFQMNIQELTTAVSNKIHVVIALFDNQALGMVRQWQNLFHDRRYSSVDLKDNPDFVKVAEAFGGRGRDVHDPEDVTPALEQALATAGGPFLLRFRLHNDENVFPIVPAGAGLDEAIGGDE